MVCPLRPGPVWGLGSVLGISSLFPVWSQRPQETRGPGAGLQLGRAAAVAVECPRSPAAAGEERSAP